VGSNPGLVTLATTIGSPPTNFLVTIAIQSVFVLSTLLGNKNVFRILWVMFTVALIGALVTSFAFLSTPTSTYISNFNRLSGMDYAKTISAASSAGLSPGPLIAATLTGLIFTVTNFFGFFSSAYFTGEVKQIRRSQVLAMFGSLVILAGIALLVYGSALNSAGQDFLTAMSFLFGTGNAAYTVPAAPVLNFMVTFAVPNQAIVFLAGLALIVTSFATSIIFTFVCVRNLFAWSFERIMPSGLAKLSGRGAPYVAIIVIWVLSLVFTYVNYYTPFFSFYVYATLAIFVTFVFVSIAAIAFPYRRKDIFSGSPSATKKMVGGLPAIVILGILGLVANVLLSYATLLPSVNPPPSGGPLLQALAYAAVPLVGVSALVIYAIASLYRKGQGIDMRRAFMEIPPE
jgi:amino acid transporter